MSLIKWCEYVLMMTGNVSMHVYNNLPKSFILSRCERRSQITTKILDAGQDYYVFLCLKD